MFAQFLHPPDVFKGPKCWEARFSCKRHVALSCAGAISDSLGSSAHHLSHLRLKRCQVPPSQGYLPRPDIMSDSYRPAEKNNFRQLSATEQVARLQARAEDQETKLHFDMVCYQATVAAEAEREPREAVAADGEAVENARELVAQEDVVGELGHHAHLEALAALRAVVVVEAERELREVVAGPTGTCTALFRCTGTCNASAGTCVSRCARHMYQSFCAIHLPNVFCVRCMYQSLVSPVHVTRVRRYMYQRVGLFWYMCQCVGGAPLKVLLLTRTRLDQTILHDGCRVL